MDKTRFNLMYLFIAMLGVTLIHDLVVRYRTIAPIPYSEFVAQLQDNNVKEVVIAANEVRGELKAPLAGGRTRFVATRVDPDLANELAKYDVKYSGHVESEWLAAILSWVVPILLFALIWIFLMRRLAGRIGPEGGLMAIGKSKAKVFVESDTKVTFKDVAGVDESKQELEEVVRFLKDRAQYGRLGARMPKGILLVGPPGTGKTLLARAVAGEAGVPFFSISGSEFVEMFVGVGAARVRDLFEQARKKAPCIIFIDELDALGRARMAGPMGGHDEKEQTLNQLLVELDGFDPSAGIVILAATNRPEILDPALLRAGRFDRQVLVDRPDRKGRADILRVHIRKVNPAPDIDLDAVASLTPGFTGADLANLVNEAALLATRRGADSVAMQDFTSAIERIIAGLEKKNRILNPREREVVAYHEMGHALVAAALPGSDKVHKVSIIPRGIGALGYTIQRPTEDRYLMSRDELAAKMAVLLGGRAAEHLVFGELSTGAADDLVRTTNIARAMVTRYAMVPKLGHVAYEQESVGFLGQRQAGWGERAYSEETAREIDCAVREIVEASYRKARGILERNRGILEEGSRLLLEKETLDENALGRLFGKGIVSPDPERDVLPAEPNDAG